MYAISGPIRARYGDSRITRFTGPPQRSHSCRIWARSSASLETWIAVTSAEMEVANARALRVARSMRLIGTSTRGATRRGSARLLRSTASASSTLR